MRAGILFIATPNPVTGEDSHIAGETSISWSTDVAQVQIRIESPDGRLFSAGGPKGSAQTGKWVYDGMEFYLQDATAPDPTSPSATLASLAVVVQ